MRPLLSHDLYRGVRLRAGLLTLAAAALPLSVFASPPQNPGMPPGCPSLVFEGDVAGTASFTRAIDAQHVFVLERIGSGWIIRVRFSGSGRPPAHDLAELATPPYQSPSPLGITTDWSFRAQDAIAWNPRSFHFFLTAAQQREALAAFAATERDPKHPAAGAALYTLLPQACPAQLRILDARIAGGNADQSAVAATVASHFAETAHTVDTAVTPTALGRVLGLRFRVTLGNGAATGTNSGVR